MADAANERLREYLRELRPEARALLAVELERAQTRGEGPPGASLILEALRSNAHREDRKPPSIGHPQRLFFAPLQPFLVDDAPECKHRGRISRACLEPIWGWICRDLMPQEARSEEHTSELQSRSDLVCRLLLEKKKTICSAHVQINLHQSQRKSRAIMVCRLKHTE